MSLYSPVNGPCPECEAPLLLRQYTSVNADRAPHLRDAIMDDSFGESACPSCGTRSRVAPELTYFDEALGLWVFVKPLDARRGWPTAEAETQGVWAQTFGPFAPGPMTELGTTLKARVVFGWAGLREKILCAQAGIDDVALEIVKLQLLASGSGDALSDETALRLAAVDEDTLEFVWLMGDCEVPLEGILAPRALLDVIAEAPEVFAAAREELVGDFYVDMARAFIDLADAAA